MAFIRNFAAQGDPYPRSFMRAGHLVVRSPLPRPRSGPVPVMPRRTMLRDYLATHPDGYLRAQALSGDPFLGKMFKKVGKALKKVTLKGVVKGVGKAVSAVAPIASLLPGVGGLAAGAIGALTGGGGRSEAAPVVEAPPVVDPAATAGPTFEDQEAMFQQWLAEYVEAQRQAWLQQAQAQAFQRIPNIRDLLTTSYPLGGF